MKNYLYEEDYAKSIADAVALVKGVETGVLNREDARCELRRLVKNLTVQNNSDMVRRQEKDVELYPDYTDKTKQFEMILKSARNLIRVNERKAMCGPKCVDEIEFFVKVVSEQNKVGRDTVLKFEVGKLQEKACKILSNQLGMEVTSTYFVSSPLIEGSKTRVYEVIRVLTQERE